MDPKLFEQQMARFVAATRANQGQIDCTVMTTLDLIFRGLSSKQWGRVLAGYVEGLVSEEGQMCLLCDTIFALKPNRRSSTEPAGVLLLVAGRKETGRSVMVSAICERCWRPEDTLQDRCMERISPILHRVGMTLICSIPDQEPIEL